MFSSRATAPVRSASWVATAVIEAEIPASARGHFFRGKMWENAERRKYDKMIAVATQERLHFAATREAKATPEPKRVGMLSRVAG